MDPVEHLSDKLQRWLSRLPGIGTYRDREDRRQADKRFREHLSARLNGAVQSLRSLERDLAESGSLSPLPQLDRTCSRIQQLADTIRYASYGYGGIFDLDKIREEELQRMYEFDLYLLDDVEFLEQDSQELRSRKADHEDLSGHLRALETRCQVLAERFERRRQFITRPS